MKKLIQNIKNSFYNQQFYKTILNKSFGESVQTLLVVSLVATLGWVVLLFPGLLEVKNYLLETVAQYPEDLVVEVADGQVSTNVVEPYFIDLPETEIDESGEEFSHLVAIDTRTQASIESFEDYDTYVLIGRNRIFYTEDGGIQSYGLSEMDDFVLDKEKVDEYTKIFKPLLWPFVILADLVAGIFMGIGAFLLYMLLLIPLALITKFVAWVKKVPLKYKEAYKVSMYAVIPAMLIDIFVSFFYPQFPVTLVVIIFLVTLTINLSKDLKQN